MVLLDALIRQLPGALNDEDSAVEDSFVDGLLDCPHYTRPVEYHGVSVPNVLLKITPRFGAGGCSSRWGVRTAVGAPICWTDGY